MSRQGFEAQFPDDAACTQQFVRGLLKNAGQAGFGVPKVPRWRCPGIRL